MLVRLSLLSLGLALLLWTASAVPHSPSGVPEAAAQDAATAPAVDVTSTVEGEIPREFLGRWVGFASVKLPSGLQRHFGKAWEVTEKEDGQLDLKLLYGQLPQSVEERMAEASEKGTAWEPTPEDLHEIEQAWDQLPRTPGANYARVETKLVAAAEYDPDFQRDAITKDSEYAIVFNETFARQAVTRSYTIFAVRNREPERMTGTFITSSTAAAPFPIPITLKGEFAAYRIGGAPAASEKKEKGWFEGLFSGCGSS